MALKIKKFDEKKVLAAPLTYEQVNELNKIDKSKKVLLVFKNTKGLKPEIIEKLNDNIIISIQGGLDPLKRAERNRQRVEDCQDRTYHTPKELITIIKIYETIERKINPTWSELEKAMFVYKKLCEYLTYSSSVNSAEETTDSLSIISLSGLITKKCMCSGFALIFKEAMDRLGIECYYQNRAGGHAWNVLKADGAYYGVDLSDETSRKKENKCAFAYFGQENKEYFYGFRHHSLNDDDDNDQTKFEVVKLTPEKLEAAKRRIEEKSNGYEKTKQISGEEECTVNGYPIIIRNNRPIICNMTNLTFDRMDGTSFAILPTGKENNGVCEYFYIEYEPENKQVRYVKIYSETKFRNLSSIGKIYIANALLARPRLETKIANYNGYVGYIDKEKLTMKFNPEVEEQLNIHRR